MRFAACLNRHVNRRRTRAAFHCAKRASMSAMVCLQFPFHRRQCDPHCVSMKVECWLLGRETLALAKRPVN